VLCNFLLNIIEVNCILNSFQFTFIITLFYFLDSMDAGDGPFFW